MLATKVNKVVTKPYVTALLSPLTSDLAVTAALFALIAEGALLVLCLDIVLDLAIELVEVEVEAEVDDDELEDMELLLLIFVLQFSHCAKVGKV